MHMKNIILCLVYVIKTMFHHLLQRTLSYELLTPSSLLDDLTWYPYLDYFRSPSFSFDALSRSALLLQGQFWTNCDRPTRQQSRQGLDPELNGEDQHPGRGQGQPLEGRRNFRLEVKVVEQEVEGGDAGEGKDGHQAGGEVHPSSERDKQSHQLWLLLLFHPRSMW